MTMEVILDHHEAQASFPSSHVAQVLDARS
jgi:hypothetical protein